MYKHHEISAPVDKSLEETERMLEANRLRQQRYEVGAYLKGYRWAVDAFIHSAGQGGNDKPISIYFSTKPTEEDIRKQLKKQNSYILNDHSAPRKLKNPNSISNPKGDMIIEKKKQKTTTDHPKQKKSALKRVEGSTVREVAERLILEKDADGQGFPYSKILRHILVQFPKAKTSIASLRWYATHMRTDRGIRVPDRPNSKSPQRELAKITTKKVG
jgi:hypothetical protein